MDQHSSHGSSGKCPGRLHSQHDRDCQGRHTIRIDKPERVVPGVGYFTPARFPDKEREADLGALRIEQAQAPGEAETRGGNSVLVEVSGGEGVRGEDPLVEREDIQRHVIGCLREGCLGIRGTETEDCSEKKKDGHCGRASATLSRVHAKEVTSPGSGDQAGQAASVSARRLAGGFGRGPRQDPLRRRGCRSRW